MKRPNGSVGILRRIGAVLCAVALLVAPALLSGCSRTQAGTILAGSTSVQPFAEVLAEEYMTLHPGTSIDIQGGGSAAGIMAAQNGTADIGMSSRSLNDTEKGLWSVEIARDGLAIVVNPANPVQGLTTAQVRDIYSAAVTNWSQLGGHDAKIHVITREEGSGTRSAFESLLMGKVQITPKAIVQDSNGAVRQLVTDDPDAIGFISLGLVTDKVKALDLDGVVPTDAHVVDGTYKLSRPFLFVAASEPTGQAKDFVDFTLSAAGQKMLATEGLIPATVGAMP